jgi:hypothetical protein
MKQLITISLAAIAAASIAAYAAPYEVDVQVQRAAAKRVVQANGASGKIVVANSAYSVPGSAPPSGRP